MSRKLKNRSGQPISSTKKTQKSGKQDKKKKDQPKTTEKTKTKSTSTSDSKIKKNSKQDKSNKQQVSSNDKIPKFENLLASLKEKADKNDQVISFKDIKDTLSSRSKVDIILLENILLSLQDMDIDVVDGSKQLPEFVLESKSESASHDILNSPATNEDSEASINEASLKLKYMINGDLDESESENEREAKPLADSPLGKSNDPVRIYLRKMGSVALLSREGEVVIAKKIENSENSILKKLLDISISLDSIHETAQRFLSSEIRMKSWIKGFDEEEGSNNEAIHEEKVRVSTTAFIKLYEDYQEVARNNNKNSEQEQLKEKMFESLKDLNLN